MVLRPVQVLGESLTRQGVDDLIGWGHRTTSMTPYYHICTV